MGSISMLQWKKAYMLEFIVKEEVKDVFTFSVPPESEDFQFPARLTETKTAGGSVFDDFGNDSYKITLSGSTVNEDKKLIYKGFGKVPQYLTGTQEIFELQKIIKNWNDGKTATGLFCSGVAGTDVDKKIYLYDLSKMSALQVIAGKASRNYWRVFIRELKIKRDKSKPFTFNYTLEMIGVEDKPPAKGGKLGAFGEVVDKIQSAMDTIKAVQDWTEGSIEAFNQISSAAQNVTKTYRAMHEQNQAGALSAGSITLITAAHVDGVSRIMGGEHNSFYNASKGLLESVSKWKNFKRITKEFKTQNTDKFKIYFNTAGGTVIGAQEVKFGSRLRKPDNPRKADYSFSGWFLDSKLTESYDFSKPVTQALVLYVGWKLEKATITFQSRNGTPVAPLKVPVGQPATPPPAPEKYRFAFEHWNSDFDCLHEFDFATSLQAAFTASERKYGGCSLPEFACRKLVADIRLRAGSISSALSKLSLEIQFSSPSHKNAGQKMIFQSAAYGIAKEYLIRVCQRKTR
ncbi:MAG: InlB B-repeat-containing protein [Treponema sp.]